MSAAKQEKKLMDEKIAKVREVVRNFSTNDIVLALHYFELDVEKTIQAFLQGKHKEALGEWEQTGGGSAKNKKTKKNKSKSAATKSSESASLASGKSTPAVTATKNVNGCTEIDSRTTAAPSAASLPAVAPTLANEVDLKGENKPSVVSYQNGGSQAANGGTVKKSKNKSKKTGTIATVATVSTDELARYQALDDSAKLKAIFAEAKQLVGYTDDLNELEKIFVNKISLSQTNVLQCFLELKQQLSDRESQLCTDLTQCREEASAIFNARRAKLIDLDSKVANVPKNVKEREALFIELKGFNIAKANDKQIAYTERFEADSAKLNDAITQFGKVFSAKASTAKISRGYLQQNKEHQHNNKSNGTITTDMHSINNKVVPDEKENYQQQNNSHLSLNAVLNGVDSDEIANHETHENFAGEQSVHLTPETKPAEKNATQLTTSGIVMQSDGLSADQMAALKKRIEETLRAQGIDPNVLSDIGMNTIATRRRQPPGVKNSVEKRGGKGGANYGNNSSTSGKAQQQGQPKLSILS